MQFVVRFAAGERVLKWKKSLTMVCYDKEVSQKEQISCFVLNVIVNIDFY